jgi:hypothetical protein
MMLGLTIAVQAGFVNFGEPVPAFFQVVNAPAQTRTPESEKRLVLRD